MEDDESDHEILKVEADKEIRIILKDSSDEVSVELIDGSGEIFGVEMIKNKIYLFTSSFVVTSFQGCTLKLRGNISRTCTENHNRDIYDLHLLLEERRKCADKNGGKGPITLIAGPTDVGKTTLTRLLLNYAIQLGRKPLYIDLDVGQSSISIPGTIGILPVEEPGDIVKGFNDAKSSVYFFGQKSPGLNMLLYYLLIKKLGETLNNRLKNSQNIISSGVIVDTCGWVTGGGYRSIVLAAKSFEVNLLIVLGDKRLYADLKEDFPDTDIKFIHRLKGVVERTKQVRAERRDNLVHEYFYGSQIPLKPYTFDVKFSDVQIFQVSSPAYKVHIDMLQEADQHISLIPVSISNNLRSHILALSYADSVDDIMLTSVLGFVCVKSVNMDQQIFTVLSPQPSPLPKNLLLMGDIQYNRKNKSKS
ncbi:protein CLP1 homolog [Argiope bruennichi]|uniref:Protein CLP1 like protein n=1 Tax=Argiope bruennichi TaxID=94029 RepID=A0A8T0DZV2_ARGBR|nr:protein CLP1 homolog [Argiope bruennichi]KAF8763499.1 Protein CLP1 like protein [Argiope bruennichi]